MPDHGMWVCGSSGQAEDSQFLSTSSLWTVSNKQSVTSLGKLSNPEVLKGDNSYHAPI